MRLSSVTKWRELWARRRREPAGHESPPVCGSHPLTSIVLAFALALGSGGAAHAQQPPEAPPSFESLLSRMASGPADPCAPEGEDFSDLENNLFKEADKVVIQELNDTSNASSGPPIAAKGSPRARALDTVAKLERLSARIDESWPEENRFHAEVFEIPPAIVLKMTYRNRGIFSFFGVPERDPFNKPNSLWQAVGAQDDGRYDPKSGYDLVDLFPLEPGPSKKARFLAKFVNVGCGSGVGVAYYAYEWSPQDTGSLERVIKVEGAQSQADPVDKHQPTKTNLSNSFPPIGELRTKGRLISFPYCWFSAIDTWDNPSLCAVDSYDISGDHIRFRGRVTNRPDLLPIAKAIEHAQAHDYSAVLAYCASPDVARRIVEDIPPFVFGGAELDVTQVADLREKVEFGDDEALRFEVQKRGDRWLVVAFQEGERSN